MEKMLKKKEHEIMENTIQFFTNFEEIFTKSDKKTYKDNLAQFFPN